jgi:hypothetical protein
MNALLRLLQIKKRVGKLLPTLFFCEATKMWSSVVVIC